MSPVELAVEDELPTDVRDAVDRYRDQGGLLGVVSYALVYLETGDERAAATAASVPTSLFVASSLHDDAIDETEPDGGTSALNYRITAGDLFFTETIEAVGTLPPSYETDELVDAIRRIGRGQLTEESEPSGDLVGRAIERIEDRGSVWGELAVAVVDATGRWPDTRLQHVDTVVSDLLFVFTLLDDVADLREDRANDTTTAPMLVYAAGHPDEGVETGVDRMLESDLEARVEAILEWREARIECATRRLHAELDDDDVLAALDRALTWYCETVCSVPLAKTVPPAVRDDIRTAMRDETERNRLLAELSVAVPSPLRPPGDAFSRADGETADRLAPVVSKLVHVRTVIDAGLVTSADEAFSSVRTRSPPPSGTATPDPSP